MGGGRRRQGRGGEGEGWGGRDRLGRGEREEWGWLGEVVEGGGVEGMPPVPTGLTTPRRT